jgi:phage anti-repressor protein
VLFTLIFSSSSSFNRASLELLIFSARQTSTATKPGRRRQSSRHGLGPSARTQSSRYRRRLRALSFVSVLHVGRDFSNWAKDWIARYGFVEGEDYVVTRGTAESGVSPKSGGNPNGGRPVIDYHGTIDMAKELAMVENNERGVAGGNVYRAKFYKQFVLYISAEIFPEGGAGRHPCAPPLAVARHESWAVLACGHSARVARGTHPGLRSTWTRPAASNAVSARRRWSALNPIRRPSASPTGTGAPRIFAIPRITNARASASGCASRQALIQLKGIGPRTKVPRCSRSARFRRSFS